MREVIRADGQVIADDWPVIEPHAVGPGLVLIESLGELSRPADGVGLAIPADSDPDLLLPALHDLPAIGVRFDSFTDGRGLSLAVLLRRLGFAAELRAIGELLPDQLRALFRCGFDAVLLPERFCPRDALTRVDLVSVHYQGSARDPEPLLRRRLAPAA